MYAAIHLVAKGHRRP